MNKNRSIPLFHVQVNAVTAVGALLCCLLCICRGIFKLVNGMIALLLRKRNVVAGRQGDGRLESLAPDFDPSEELDPTRPIRVSPE